ncbi:Phosphoethanolamine N-methyltransferase [Hondaea fermentalgiana]|uniref:Phosphoethanolamine N-methyltransferase n=1 Tax=Hondaea fermentalgiana TaxID=2315210 RepID=A0A2R5GJ68_9STRA|nr:Phosphoethanolamine N-methyltransferase [Hondaea fermentalgiana]|eukprot:GBG30936.1 Phosphoethanolamine N-methyltransferase [Hondaea fermentalgiana]
MSEVKGHQGGGSSSSDGNGGGSLLGLARDTLGRFGLQDENGEVSWWVSSALQATTVLFWFGVGSGLVLARSKLRASKTRAQRTAQDAQAKETAAQEASQEAALAAADQLYQTFGGMLTSATLYVGDQLGLYEELRLAGPITSAQLAARTGLHERWLHEWLLQNASAKILRYDRKTCAFSMVPGYDIALTDPNCAGMFQMGPALVSRIAALKHIMQDPAGLGETYDGSFKDDIAMSIERMHTSTFKTAIPDGLFMSHHVIDGNLPKLLGKGGMRVAEIGCGTATGLVELARRFPQAEFHGFELSSEAISQAQNRISRARVKNATIHDVRETPIEANSFDFCFCHDVVHDCAQPEPLIRDAFRGLRPGGTFLIVDIRTFSDDADIVTDPASAVRLGFSCGLCLHSSSSEKDGARLGTLGLKDGVISKYLSDAGFENFQSFTCEALPTNSCFTARKPDSS